MTLDPRRQLKTNLPKEPELLPRQVGSASSTHSFSQSALGRGRLGQTPTERLRALRLMGGGTRPGAKERVRQLGLFWRHHTTRASAAEELRIPWAVCSIEPGRRVSAAEAEGRAGPPAGRLWRPTQRRAPARPAWPGCRTSPCDAGAAASALRFRPGDAGHSGPRLGQLLHHLLRLAEPDEQLVDVADLHAGTGGDALASRAADLFGCERSKGVIDRITASTRSNSRSSRLSSCSRI